MKLAFRIFGSFHWPPVPSKPVEPPAKTLDGLVEIYFGDKGGIRYPTITLEQSSSPRGGMRPIAISSAPKVGLATSSSPGTQTRRDLSISVFPAFAGRAFQTPFGSW